MKVLLHGENTEQSRAEFVRLKEQCSNSDIRDFTGKQLDETSLVQAVASDSLFGTDTSIFIENLFSPLGKKVKTAAQYADIIKNANKTFIIVLWESKGLGKETIHFLEPDVSIRLFDYPKIIFTFLDSIVPGGSKKSLALLEELLVTEPSELVWSMLVSRIRVLMQIKDKVIPERMSSWQLSRLTNQARLFTMNKLLSMHKNLLTSEYSLKQGISPYATADNIQVLLASL